MDNDIHNLGKWGRGWTPPCSPMNLLPMGKTKLKLCLKNNTITQQYRNADYSMNEMDNIDARTGRIPEVPLDKLSTVKEKLLCAPRKCADQGSKRKIGTQKLKKIPSRTTQKAQSWDKPRVAHAIPKRPQLLPAIVSCIAIRPANSNSNDSGPSFEHRSRKHKRYKNERDGLMTLEDASTYRLADLCSSSTSSKYIDFSKIIQRELQIPNQLLSMQYKRSNINCGNLN